MRKVLSVFALIGALMIFTNQPSTADTNGVENLESINAIQGNSYKWWGIFGGCIYSGRTCFVYYRNGNRVRQPM